MMDTFDDRLHSVENRLKELENKFDTLSLASVSNSNELAPKVRFKSVPPIDTSLLALTPTSFSIWFKENWLVSIGIFLTLLAGSWFISYAFANDWLGEKIRIFLEFICGAIIYLTGFLLLKKQPKGAQALLILGDIIILLSFFACYQANILFPFQTFLLMLTVINLTAILAIKQNIEGLAISSIIFAAIIPFLLDIQYSPIFVLCYALLINTAALWMLTMRGWGKTFHIAWITTFIYSIAFSRIEEQIVIYFFMWAFYLTFFLSIAVPVYRKQLPSLPLKGAFILVTLTLAFILWVNSFATYPGNAISLLAVALLSSILGYFMVKNWDQITPTDNRMKYILGAITGFSAMAFIFLATDIFTNYFLFYPVSVDARILLYFVEVVAAIIISCFIIQSPTAAIYFSLAFANPFLLLWDSPSNFFYTSFYSLQFTILCSAILSLFTAAIINEKVLLSLKLSITLQRLVVNCLWIMATIFSMLLVWNICHQIVPTNNIARGIALVIYIITAEILIYSGNLKQSKNIRIGGVAIILFVISRLLLEEIWEMPIIVRMITFAAIGLLLIGTAFFDKTRRNLSFKN
jgi:hypothetical protein